MPENKEVWVTVAIATDGELMDVLVDDGFADAKQHAQLLAWIYNPNCVWQYSVQVNQLPEHLLAAHQAVMGNTPVNELYRYRRDYEKSEKEKANESN